MRHNHRPVMAASSFTPNKLSLYDGEKPTLVCPDCDRWRGIQRGMVVPHRAEDGVSRCPGSGQRVRIDLTPGQWQERYREAAREAARRQPTRVYGRSTPPPIPTPIARIGGGR